MTNIKIYKIIIYKNTNYHLTQVTKPGLQLRLNSR